MRVDNNSLVQASANQAMSESLESASRTMQEVARTDFAGANRLASDSDETLREVGKLLIGVGNLIESSSQRVGTASTSSTQMEMGQLLENAGELLINAATLLESLNTLLQSNNDARQIYQNGQKQLQDAGRELKNSNGRVEDAAGKAATSTREAGQSICRGMQATERGKRVTAPQTNNKKSPPRLTSQVLRQEILKRMEQRCNELPKRPEPLPEPSPQPTPTPAPTTEPTPLPEPQPAPQPEPLPGPPPEPVPTDKNAALKARINGFIENNVNKVLFDKLKLKPRYEGNFSRAGERKKSYGKGVTTDEVKDYALTGGINPYGMEGRTLAETSFAATFGRVDRSAQGNWGSAFVNGSTSVGARGRVFGDASLRDRRAYIGAEGEVGVGATYNAGYSSPRVTLAGQQVALDAGVAADIFAGGRGRGKIDVSLRGNEPHVAVGGEVFAGARATIAGGAAATINGQTVAEVHGRAEGWAGVGAKADIDVGFKNGKFTFNAGLGAALGIGGSVDWGFTVDVASIGKGIANGVNNIVNKAVDNIEDLGKELGKTATTVAQRVGSAVGTAAREVGDAIGDGIKEAGNAVKSFFKKIF